MTSSDDPPAVKTGRPTVRTPELIERILARVRDGWPRGRAAEREGIDARTLRRWQAEDPDLLSDLKGAEAQTAGVCWGALLDNARNGDRESAKYLIDKRFTDPPEVDQDALADHAARLYRLGQEMRGSVPTDPNDGPPAPKHVA